MSPSISLAHQDNLVRWSPDHPTGMYESHFMKLNMLDEQRAFWCRFTILQRETGPCAFEVWAIIFDSKEPGRSFALKQQYAADAIHIARDKLALKFGPNELLHGHSQGALSDHRHEVRWNVCWSLETASLRHFPQDSLYEGDFPKTKLVSPALNSQFEGTLEIDGEVFELTDTPGMQGHNWGRQHAETWVWTHCNTFDVSNAVFEGVSSHIQLGPFRSPPLTILHFAPPDESPITINSWSDMILSRGSRNELTWRFRGAFRNRAVEGWFNAPPERFVGVHYEDPTTTITNCLNSKVADGQVRLLHKDRGVWRLKQLFIANTSAALEIGVKGESYGVQIHL